MSETLLRHFGRTWNLRFAISVPDFICRASIAAYTKYFFDSLALRNENSIKASFASCNQRTESDLHIFTSTPIAAWLWMTNRQILHYPVLYFDLRPPITASPSFNYNLYHLLQLEQITANLPQFAATSFVTAAYDSLAFKAPSTAYRNVGKICV